MKQSLLLIAFIFILTGCSSKIETLNKKNENFIEFKNEPWFKNKQNSPKLGIALSGGGSKSAPFAMGVLKRFVDEKWLNSVDIISSVSGGSYSAYYLYSKALYEEEKNPKTFSLDKYFKNYELDKLYCAKCSKDYDKKVNTYEMSRSYGKDEFRYQLAVKQHQDLLSYSKSEKARGEDFTDNIQASLNVIEVLGGSLFTLPLHHLTNTLFDWKLELVPSQYKYESGIVRAFGTVDGVNKSESFSSLARLTNSSKVPMWIINTSNFERDWLTKDPYEKNYRDLSSSIFELTPYSYGSGRYSFRNESPDNLGLDLSRGTLASAAFFDALGGSPLLFGLLHIPNLRWAIKVPNYTVSKHRRNIHKFIPFPFYYLDMKNSDITLSDGGQSGDNLGLYALIRRGTKNIVIVSGSDDTDFLRRSKKLKLDDICRVNNYLVKKENLEIIFEGEANNLDDKSKVKLEEICKRDKDDRYEYYKWKKKVWRGIVQDKITKEKKNDLYFIKAAINASELSPVTRSFFNGNKNRSLYPSSLLKFWGNSSYGECAADFPQTSTVWNTLNSSQNLYQAYLDLGFYLSGFLKKEEFLK